MTARPSRPVFLCGFMGAGKTTVGRLLALRLGVPFADLDEVIAQENGVRSVAEIFDRHGEREFRRQEAETVLRFTRDPQVVATGGGTAAQSGLLDRLLAAGTVVTLATPLEECLARAARDGTDRPLLRAAGERALQVALLYAERRAAYARAHVIVPTSGRTPEDIAEEIAVRVREREGGPGIVRVGLGERSYDVHVARGVVERTGEIVLRLCGGGPVGLVTEPRVLALHGAALIRSIEQSGLPIVRSEVAEGEAAKTLATVEAVADTFVRGGLDRGRPVIGFGGGAVGDLAGMVAATLYRGVPYIAIPTTLLAQADAAIGGKTAVNLPAGKNLLGAFHQPRAVLEDTALLATLEPRDLASGMAEIVKHALLGDRDLFARMEAAGFPAELRADDGALLERIVLRSAEIKARVVERDERETGPRALLNLGHTVGHAIESAAGVGALRHGEAVSLGLILAARVSAALGLAPPTLEARVAAVLAPLGLPVDPAPWLRPDVLDRIAIDKKRSGDVVRFVALRDVGEPEIVPLRLAELRAKLEPGVGR